MTKQWRKACVSLMTLVLLVGTMAFGSETHIGKDGQVGQGASVEALQVGDVVGTFHKSEARVLLSIRDEDIGIDIFEMPIPVYTVDNVLHIVVEDLVHYGYALDWDGEERVAHLRFSNQPDQPKGTRKHIKNQGNILHTDIQVKVND